MFKRKSLDRLMHEADGGVHGLRRALGALNLVSLGVGAIIGAGIFVVSGEAAQCAGPAIVLSCILSAIGCAFAGLCYAEFASMIPISGSAYTYAYATIGEFFAWIIGWDLILEYLFGAASVAVGWSGYMVSFLHDCGVVIPPQFAAATGTHPASMPQVTAIVNVPAILIVAVIMFLLVIGIRESAWFNNLIVLVKVSVLLLFIVFGFMYVKSDNWVPIVPDSQGWGQYGWSGVLRGAGIIFFAYIGFDTVSTTAQEAKNPRRDMPIGILGSLAICTVLYVLVTLVATGLVRHSQLGIANPLTVAISAAGPALNWLRPLINLGAIAGLTSVMLVLLIGQPRIFYSMSRDGLLPPVFSKVHPRFKTPYVTTIVTGVAVMIVAGTVNIDILGKLVAIGTLLAFMIVCIGVWVL